MLNSQLFHLLLKSCRSLMSTSKEKPYCIPAFYSCQLRFSFKSQMTRVDLVGYFLQQLPRGPSVHRRLRPRLGRPLAGPRGSETVIGTGL